MRAFLIAVAILVGSAVPAGAHAVAGDSYPGAEHDVCVGTRPYDYGAVYAHYRITGPDRLCYVRYPGNNCFAYFARLWFVWTGPHDTVRVPCP